MTSILSAVVFLALAEDPKAYPAPLTLDVASTYVGSIALADVNLDGIDDLVLTLEPQGSPHSIEARLGDGAGGFAPGTPVVLHPTAAAIGLLVADVSGDGAPDALVSLSNVGGTGAVAVSLGNGAGGFAPPLYLGGGAGITPPSTGDLTGDGLLDLAAGAYWTNDIAVHLNTGHGFVLAAGASQTHPTIPAIGDVTGDGVADLVVTPLGLAELDLFPGDGAGGFGAKTILGVPFGVPGRAILADLTGDGILDACLPLAGPVAAASAAGLPAGGFAPFVPAPLAGAASDLIPTMFDGDGRLDAVAILDAGPAILLGDGAGGFSSATRYAGLFGARYAVGRVDPGASADVFAVETLSGLAAAFRNDGAGGLAAARAYPIPGDTEDFVLGDLDGDGAPDAVVSRTNSPTLTVARGDGAGGFLAPGTTPTIYRTRRLVLADFDEDGRADAVVAIEDSLVGSVGRVGVHLGDGAGGFGAPILQNAGDGPQGVATGDFDGDGHADAAVSNLFSNDVTVLLGDGTGSLAPGTPHFVGVRPRGLAAADLDHDGDLDLAVGIEAGGTGGFVSVLLGDGAGSFAPATLYDANINPDHPLVADLDRDGNQDVVVAGGLAVTVLRGDGFGNLFGAVGWPLGAAARDLRVADVDGDAALDAIVTNDQSSDTIAVAFGNGLGGFGAVHRFVAGGLPRVLDVADLDADGRLDVVVASAQATDGNLGVLRHLGAPPAGTAPYGAGTPGCLGTLGLEALSAPKVGNGSFRLAASNAPASSLGLALVADAPDVAGNDLFGLGALLHVDLPASQTILGFDAWSDPAGGALAFLPIPTNPALAGATFYAQTLWIVPKGAACFEGPLDVRSSRAVRIDVLP